MLCSIKSYDGVNPFKISWLRQNVLSNIVADISKISILLPINVCSISNLFRIELLFKWAIMIQCGSFLRISFNALFFGVSSDKVSFTRYMAEWSNFSLFSKLVKDLKFIWESKHEDLNTTDYTYSHCKLFNSPNKDDSKFA